jgi:hypothetical protein
VGDKAILRHLKKKHPASLKNPDLDFATELQKIRHTSKRLKVEAESFDAYFVGRPCWRYYCGKCGEDYGEKKNAARHLLSKLKKCKSDDISHLLSDRRFVGASFERK